MRVVVLWLLACLLLALARPLFAEEHPTLVAELYRDFEVTADIQDLVRRAEHGLQLQKSNLRAAQQHFEQLAADLPAQTPSSLRRQIRSFACFSDDRGIAQRLMEQVNQWLQTSNAKTDAEEKATYLLCLSALQFNAARHNEAFAAMAEAHELLTPYPRSIVFADLLLSRGYMTSYLGDVEGATKLLTRARELYQQLKVMGGVGTADLYLAHTYNYTGQAQAAREIYRQLLDDTLAKENHTSLPLLYHSIATTFDVSKEADAALEWLKKGLAHAESVDDQMALAHTHLALSHAYRESQQWTAATLHAQKSQHYSTAMGSADLTHRAELEVLAVALQTNPDRVSVEQLNTLQTALEALQDMPSLMQLSQLKLALYKKKKQFESALTESERLLTLHREFSEKNSAESTERMRATYQLERRVEENQRLREQHQAAEKELNAVREMRSLQLAVLVMALALLLIIAVWGYKQLKLRNTMQSLALTDELTQLPNRRNVLSFATLQFVQATTLNEPLSVIVFDVDHFKQVNDHYGHEGGDRVLKHLARVVEQIGRHHDRLGRVGGEEFMMVLPGTDLTRALLVAERLRQHVEQTPVTTVAEGLTITISSGVACKSSQDAELSDLIARADRALYRAKHNGRNRVERDGGDA